ncbi:CoA transferase [Bacillus spongiae]|uniref:CoA transferase n=1 Tax=Bacillus spongiae TaxID=2683610 RepID=A0ABU8HI24_9BACI
MLSGVRVLDFTNYLPGPYATLRLADLGAEVIKVEPIQGDPARHLANGFVYEANNRNKQSIAMDLKNPANVNSLYQLLPTVDVVIESFRPGVMKRFELDYETVKKIKEDIVYCSLTGFGQAGENAHLGSHDLNYQGLSGFLSQHKDGHGDPIHPSITTADLTGGLVATERIMAALFHRERTGMGSYLDLALNDTLISMLTSHAAYQSQLKKPDGPPALEGSVVCYHLYKTKDHRFVSLAALEPHFWTNFCTAAGKEEWVPQAFTKATESNEVFQAITALFSERTMEEWAQFGLDYDCCLFPVLKVDEVLQHSYLEERDLISREGGKVNIITNTNIRTTPPPKLGEHHNAVFKDLDRKSFP